MAHHISCAQLVLTTILVTTKASYNPFSDNILFSIGWPGPGNLDPPPTGASTVVMTTPDQEKYKCFIPPELNDSNKNVEASYEGPDEMGLLRPLLVQTSCSYRIDNYWTYELCHGKFLRQYHEEKEAGKKMKVQQYFLGYGDVSTAKDKKTSPPEMASDNQQQEHHKKKVPLQKVEGLEIPYFAIEFSGGTSCDLTGQPRRVSIHYVCQPDGKGEIYELKETSTCEYEMVVLTSLLCSHPSYQSKKDPVSQIHCHALPGSPPRPRSLENLHREKVQARYNPHDKDVRGIPRKVTTTYMAEGDVAKKVTVDVSTNKLLIQEFLNGDYCVHGGVGWWKHELCLGKKVIQFHKEQDGRMDIVLGRWNVQAHLAWLEEHPTKKPKPLSQRKTISHFYGSGDICDLTGKPRQVEVRLKCKDVQKSSDAVGIYLVEASTCMYVLVVESPILCPIIEKADDNGLRLPADEASSAVPVQSIRITVGNDHYMQQAAAAEKVPGQTPSGGPSGRAGVDGRGDNIEGKGCYPNREQRWSTDQQHIDSRNRYFENRFGERHPQDRNQAWSGERRSRSPERYPSRDYRTSRDRRSYSQERRSSTDSDRRDYQARRLGRGRSYYRHSPDRGSSRSPGRRDYRWSPGRNPDRRPSPDRSPNHRRSPGRSPDRRAYRRSPGRRSTSHSPDSYRRSPARGSRSPSTSRSSYSTNDTHRDHPRDSDPRVYVQDKEHHADSPIFRGAAEFRGTDGIPDTPPVGVRSILKNKADVTPIESPSPFRSDTSIHGDVPFSVKPQQSHFGLPGIGSLDEIEDEDEFLYGGVGDKPATREPIISHEIPSKPQCETFDYGHKAKQPEIKSFPSSLVPDYDEDAAHDEHPARRAYPSAASTLRPASPPSKTEKKKEPYDPTIENILKAIGFNFELSKLMQEKAKKEREKQEKKDDLGSYGINQTSSFLGSGLKNIDLGSVFDQKGAGREEPVAEKKEPAKAELSYQELGRKYREEQMRAYEQGRSSPPPFHEMLHMERSRRKSDSLSPPRKEWSRRRSDSPSPPRRGRSRRRSDSSSPPPLRRRHRSPSFDHGSPRPIKRSRSVKDPEPAQMSPPRSAERLLPPTENKPASSPPSTTVSQPYSVPPPYYGAPGWDPYGPYGAAYTGQHGYYPPPGQYPMEWPPHYHPNYPPPSMHPDMPYEDNKFFMNPPISSNLKVIPVVDDIADKKPQRKSSDSSAASPSQKPSSRTVLPPKPEPERRVEVRHRDDTTVEACRWDDQNTTAKTDDRRRDDQKMTPRRDSRSRPTLSQEARERLMVETQQRRTRLKALEKELDTLRRQQNELMRKKQRQRDGHKDPLLMENSKLQDEIAQQISVLRHAAEQNSSTLKAAGISDIETDDRKRSFNDKSSQRRIEKTPSVKTEKPADKPKDEEKAHEYFDPGNHWCRVCNHISTNIFDLFSHLHTKKHQQKVDRYDRPWVPLSLAESKRPKKPSKAQLVVAPIRGVEFMMGTQAFYCSLCGTFSGDGACAEHHLKSKDHNDKYNDYCSENPFYERHYDLDRAAGLSVIKFEGQQSREPLGLEEELGIEHSAAVALTKDQKTVELVRRRVEAVERKIRIDKPRDESKCHFQRECEFGGLISSVPPPSHHPRPKDRFTGKEAAKEQQKERHGISIKLSGKPQVKFPVKNPLSSSTSLSKKKPEPSLFRPVVKRPEQPPPKPVPQTETVFPLRKPTVEAEVKTQPEEAEDYMSSVDMFVTSSDGTKKKKKPVPVVKAKPKALSQSDIAKAFGGREEGIADGSGQVTTPVTRNAQMADQMWQPVAGPGLKSALTVGSKQPDLGPGSEALAKPPQNNVQTISAIVSTISTGAKDQPVADSGVVPSDQDNEDAKSEGSGMSMGSDFEILDELNAG